jgi:hypothetical protein
MAFDQTRAAINMGSFKECDQREFHGDVSKPAPPAMPQPRAGEVEIRSCIDSDHAGDQLITRSCTCFFAFINSAPLIWFLKRQQTLETSVLGAKFVAMKNGLETVRALRHKLRVMASQSMVLLMSVETTSRQSTTRNVPNPRCKEEIKLCLLP